MFDKNLARKIAKRENEINGEEFCNEGVGKNLIPLFFVFGILICILLYSVFKLQVMEAEDMYSRSYRNQIKVVDIVPRRGVFFDRNGRKLVENLPSVDCYINMGVFFEEGLFNDELLKENVTKLEEILGVEYHSILERIYVVFEKEPDVEKVLVASGLENDFVIDIKSLDGEIKGLELEEGSVRNYIYKESLSHVLGYTSIVSAEDLERLDYVSYNDIVGRIGLEKQYDSYLVGEKGKIAVEVNALGQVVSESNALLQEAVAGKSLYLSVDLEAQQKAFEILKEGVEEYNATSGSIIIQDVKTGEILVMSNYPSFDSNVFERGVSQEEFEKLLNAKGNPLTNKAISAQVPPGSMFKPIVAASALDAGAISKDTMYVSKAGYSFSGGALFPEYQNKVYGSLDVVSAIMLSSNIYFCELIRNWDMNKLVPYLANFGIGEYTGIDIPGEGAGRLPSPQNKVELAKTTSPWLEPYWYPEGDSCNSVIGQGITTTTPIQAVNWVSAIANGGVLHTPHLVKKVVNDTEEVLQFNEKNKKFISKEALGIVREGMRESVAGQRRVIIPLTDAKVEVAAKTGTAEFGKLGADGRYEHTHAWVNGFFPYDSPKYSFVVFLEDGGASNNAAEVAREMIDWFADEIVF